MIRIYFACDAGLGSSALGASLFSKLCKQRKLEISIKNCSIYDLPKQAKIVLCHEYFYDYAIKNYPEIKIYVVSNFMDSSNYERVIRDMVNQEILKKENILLQCKALTSDEAIQAIGKQLVDSGYITERYIEGMFERDHSLTTYIGNDIAIPHGEFEYKDEIIKTGLAVMIYPEGISWGGGHVRVVIGIAAKNDDHMEILANIAGKLSEMDTVEELVASDNVDFIHELLTKGEDA